ncbi:hypothetical protein [Sorangium sp. So ce1024]|uniref:hypothetical protein n=1 Tax=Sorangium sp. So ce1024 TaxID=3133327 RepID=UPI003F129183
MTPAIVAIGTPASFRGVYTDHDGFPRTLGVDVWEECARWLGAPGGLRAFAEILLRHETWDGYTLSRAAEQVADGSHPAAPSWSCLGHEIRTGAATARLSVGAPEHITEANDLRVPAAYTYCIDPDAAALWLWRCRCVNMADPPDDWRYERTTPQRYELRLECPFGDVATVEIR